MSITTAKRAETARDIKNALLRQIAQEVYSELPGDRLTAFQSIYACAVHTAFEDANAEELRSRLDGPEPMDQKIADVCADILEAISATIKLDLNVLIPVVAPVGALLMCHILEHVHSCKRIEIRPDFIRRCMVTTTNAVMAKFGMRNAGVVDALALVA